MKTNVVEATKKSIFEYKDYREFLKDSYDFKKSINPKFSYRHFSRMTGFKSPSALIDVIKGRTGLKDSGIRKFAKALGLTKEETNFFRNLVHFNQAKNPEDKETYASQILKSEPYQKIHPLNQAQFQCYAYWYIVPIREMVATRGFRTNPEWIAKKIRPNITPTEASRALDILSRLGMIKKDEKGKFIQSEPLLTTGDEVSSLSVTRFHKEMLKKGSLAISTYPRDMRDISALTLRLPLNQIGKIKEMIQEFRKDVMGVLNTLEGPARIYQMNLQLFPVTEILDPEAETETEDEE